MRSKTILLIIRMAFGAVLAFALEPALSNETKFEFISQRSLADLERSFGAAEPFASHTEDLNKDSIWSCSMFGVRSRMFVRQQDRLYKFKATGSPPAQYINSGTHTLKTYNIEGHELSARNGKISETVRWLAPNKIIAQLRSNKSLDSRPQVILAYNLCSVQ